MELDNILWFFAISSRLQKMAQARRRGSTAPLEEGIVIDDGWVYARRAQAVVMLRCAQLFIL